MRTLVESLMDPDFDIDERVVLNDLAKETLSFDNNEMPNLSSKDGWVIFDCAPIGKEIFLITLEPFKKAGYNKFKFVNCKEIMLNLPDNHYYGEWDGVEIDAPDAKLIYNDIYELTLDRVTLNVNSVMFSVMDSSNAKIKLNRCKFDTALIQFQAITHLSISDTCKFTNCKLLYLGRVGGVIAKRAADLKMGSFTLTEYAFRDQVRNFINNDEEMYWDIDVMKTLKLNPSKWPDLGKIVIVPNGVPASSAPGLCLYTPRKAMLPLSNYRDCGDWAEFANNWKGRYVSKARTEMNGIKK